MHFEAFFLVMKQPEIVKIRQNHHALWAFFVTAFNVRSACYILRRAWNPPVLNTASSVAFRIVSEGRCGASFVYCAALCRVCISSAAEAAGARSHTQNRVVRMKSYS